MHDADILISMPITKEQLAERLIALMRDDVLEFLEQSSPGSIKNKREYDRLEKQKKLIKAAVTNKEERAAELAAIDDLQAGLDFTGLQSTGKYAKSAAKAIVIAAKHYGLPVILDEKEKYNVASTKAVKRLSADHTKVSKHRLILISEQLLELLPPSKAHADDCISLSELARKIGKSENVTKLALMRLKRNGVATTNHRKGRASGWRRS